METRLLWGLAGLLSYVAAAVTLTMAVAPMFESGTPDALSPEMTTVGLVVVSAMLFGLGGLCLRRAAAGASRAAGFLTAGSDREASVSSHPEDETDAESVRCPNCGTVNDASYTYCEECASNL